MTIYIYDSHLGNGPYFSHDEKSYNDCYCEQCGDFDQFLCTVTSVEEAKKWFKKNNNRYLFYAQEVIDEFLEELKKVFDK